MKLIRYCALIVLISTPLCQAQDKKTLLLSAAANTTASIVSGYLAYQSFNHGYKAVLKSRKRYDLIVNRFKLGYFNSFGDFEIIRRPTLRKSEYTLELEKVGLLGKQVVAPLAYLGLAYFTTKTALERAVKAYKLLKEAFSAEETSSETKAEETSSETKAEETSSETKEV